MSNNDDDEDDGVDGRNANDFPPSSPSNKAGGSFSSVCILGCSGSGKTSLVKSLLKVDGRHVVVFNSNGEDYGELDAEDREWNPDSLEDLQDCCVVFEDLIAPAPKKMATIKKVAHYFQRRRNVSLYVLSHEIHHTGLYSLIGQMDKIYVTSGPKNAKLYKDLAKFQFHIEPSTVEALKNKRFHYLEINTRTGSYRVLNSKLEDVMDSLRNDLLAKRMEVEKCLKAFPSQCTILMQIFDIIFKNFSSALLTPNDLCVPIKVGSAKSRTRKVPIIDFLLSLRLPTKPDRDVLLLKRFMDSKLTLPRTLISNEYLRSTTDPAFSSSSSSTTKKNGPVRAKRLAKAAVKRVARAGAKTRRPRETGRRERPRATAAAAASSSSSLRTLLIRRGLKAGKKGDSGRRRRRRRHSRRSPSRSSESDRGASASWSLRYPATGSRRKPRSGRTDRAIYEAAPYSDDEDRYSLDEDEVRGDLGSSSDEAGEGYQRSANNRESRHHHRNRGEHRRTEEEEEEEEEDAELIEENDDDDDYEDDDGPEYGQDGEEEEEDEDEEDDDDGDAGNE